MPKSNVTAPPPAAGLSCHEAANYLGVKPGTLDQWRSKERQAGSRLGPRYSKLGKKVIYRISDLDDFLVENQVDPSSSDD